MVPSNSSDNHKIVDTANVVAARVRFDFLPSKIPNSIIENADSDSLHRSMEHDQRYHDLKIKPAV